MNQTLPFSKKWNVNVRGAGRVYLGTSAALQVNRGNISTSGPPRNQEMLNCSCSPVTACQGHRVPRVSGPQGNSISASPGVPPKNQADLWGRAHPPFHPTDICEQTQHRQSWSQDVPGRTDFAVFSPSFINQFPWLQWHQPLFTLL